MREDCEGNLLLEKARAGDRVAFGALVECLEVRFVAFLRTRIHSEARARLDLDEIVQDTYVRASTSLGGFRGGDLTAFARWILGIARFAVIKAAGPLRGGELPIEADAAGSGPTPSRILRREERRDRLEAAIGSLRGDSREILVLTSIEGLSLKDAADRMGRSPGAARKLFGRALRKLRERFGDTESLHLPDREILWGGKEHAE